MKTNLTGIIEGLSPEAYHKAPGISYTGYKQFLRSPRHYKTYTETPSEQTASQLLGQLVHCMTLEASEVEKRFKRIGERATPKLKEECKAQGLTAVNDTTWEKAENMAKGILAHDEAKYLIQTGQREVSGFWNDPMYGGIMRKCRPDIWHAETEIICDVKYVGDASEKGFEKMCMRMQYHLQSAWYLEVWGRLIGKKLMRHVHICVEDEAPYAVQLHALSDHDLEQSSASIHKTLVRYAECMKNNQWPGYESGVRTLVLPHYAYQMTDEGEVL